MGENPTNADYSKYLIDLIINQDHVAQSWIKFLMTVQAGLAVGFATSPSWLQKVTTFVVPLLAIAITFALSRIVIRERKWQTSFVERFQALPENRDKVFFAGPRKTLPDSTVAEQPWGVISSNIFLLAIVICLAWLGVWVWAILRGTGVAVTPIPC